MSITKKGVMALMGAAAITLGVVLASASARDMTPYRWQNCAHVHMKYRHCVRGVEGASLVELPRTEAEANPKLRPCKLCLLGGKGASRWRRSR